jgi:putative colanic acid biosynthesis glycosyltransferase WcaI
MRIVLVEQYFYPDGWGGAEIPRDIAIGLSEAGVEVEVLCGADQYAPLPPGAAATDPTAHGVKIVRIPRILPGPARRLRTLRILWFCVCAVPALLLRSRVALILTQTNPPLIVPTVALVAALRRTPFAIIAQDVYPEVLFASGATSPDGLSGRALTRLFAWAYRRANRVVVLGSFMRQRILRKGVSPERIVTISNWATGALRREHGTANPLRVRWGLQNRFVVLYSGNIGVGHEFATFLAGVRYAAATRAELAVVFIGAGSRLDAVRDLTRSLGIEGRVMFRDFVPAEELPLSMGIADLALVTLREGFEGVIVPSKLFGYMARGIPTLYVGPPSDIAEYIETAACGACCGTGQDAAVAEVLCRAMRSPEQLQRWSDNGQSFYNQYLKRELAVRRYLDVTRDAIRQP